MSKNLRLFSVLAALALFEAVLRYYMKRLVQPLGVSDFAGSFFASVTFVLLVGLALFFMSEGRARQGRYLIAVVWFAALDVWCQALIVSGILITARTGAATYYEEMLGSHKTLAAVPHAISHLIATLPVLVVGMILGLPIYWLAKRGRPSSAAAGA